jgi:hypothetical protein
MIDSGTILYVLLGGMLWLFWRNMHGLSFDQRLTRDTDLHYQVHRVFAKHPHGGTWREFQQWIREEQGES